MKLTTALLLGLLAAPAFAEPPGLAKGVAEYRSENYEEAVQLLQEVRAADPSSSIAAFYLGMALKQEGNLQAAQQNLRDALSLSPPVYDACLELAELLYEEERLQEAKELIARAERQGVRPAQAAFLRGLVLAREGDGSGASAAFRRAGAADPSLRQAAELQVAMLYVKERRLGEARDLLRELVRINPGSDLASFAAEYEKGIGKSMDDYRVWRGYASASFQYDDNVVAAPADPRVAVLVSDRSDIAAVTELRLGYSPLPSGPYTFDAEYAASSVLHRRINGLDVITQTITLNPGRRFGPGALNLPVSFMHMFLHQAGYTTLLSVRPTFRYVLSDDDVLQGGLGYTRRELLQKVEPEEDRDGGTCSAAASWFRSFAGGQGIFSAGYELSRENAEGRNWRNIGNRFSSSLLLPLAPRLNGNLGAEVLLQDFTRKNTNVADASGDFVRRHDRVYNVSAGLSWRLAPQLNATAGYQHTTANSNLPIYDYR
ncbi:MAG TPA: tetratricopeptide repeat protein, partial [Verrucomicrobiae bacterium]|nr:tetratricopeptide repeat protein [Verrucomicrobiae bacterium]